MYCNELHKLLRTSQLVHLDSESTLINGNKIVKDNSSEYMSELVILCHVVCKKKTTGVEEPVASVFD